MLLIRYDCYNLCISVSRDVEGSVSATSANDIMHFLPP